MDAPIKPEPEPLPEGPASAAAETIEPSYAAAEDISDLQNEGQTERVRQTEEIIQKTIKTMSDNFKDGGSGLKFADFISDFYKFDDNTKTNLKSVLKKLYSGEEGNPPFGFRETQSGSGVFEKDPNVSPDNLGMQFSQDGTPNIDKLFEDFETWKSKNSTNINKYKITPDELGALKKFSNKSGNYARNAIKLPLTEDIASILKKKPSEITPDEKTRLQKFMNDRYGAWDKNETEQLNKNTSQARAKTGENIDKPYSKWKAFAHFLFFLEFSGTLATILYFTTAYANAHTGCMEIFKLDSNSFITSQKVLCNKTNGYPPNLCYCKLPDDTKQFNKTRAGCSQNEDAIQPRPAQYPDTDKLCLGDINKGIQESFRYYSYQIMTPGGAIPDIIKKSGQAIVQGFGPILEMIIHAAIVIGIIIGVLLVLWIIYKVVANRKPAETLKIETVGAPSTVTKFGNRGYLGNLSKYSNYAFMGRCVAQPARPHIPSRFKF
uniref:Uncharacterized protein n=1 Tax=viral metagenome TaxID=1070528 RepID=A0A6C0LE64_9ZZZZ